MNEIIGKMAYAMELAALRSGNDYPVSYAMTERLAKAALASLKPEMVKLRIALALHDQWHKQAGTVKLMPEGTEINLPTEYQESDISERTTDALSEMDKLIIDFDNEDRAENDNEGVDFCISITLALNESAMRLGRSYACDQAFVALGKLISHLRLCDQDSKELKKLREDILKALKLCAE